MAPREQTHEQAIHELRPDFILDVVCQARVLGVFPHGAVLLLELCGAVKDGVGGRIGNDRWARG